MGAGFDKQCVGGLTAAQLRMLAEVGQAGSTPSQLADKLTIERATVSAVSERLVKAGLLARSEGANKRSHVLKLTEAGKKAIGSTVPKNQAFADSALAELTAKETALLGELLVRIERSVKAAIPLGHERER
jgi:DNA-binding MarR family transcriptional regulator